MIGDIHDERERLRSTLELVQSRGPDLALLTGDIGRDLPWLQDLRRSDRAGHDESVRTVVAMVRTVLRCPVVFVPGNHDMPDPPLDVEGINADRAVVEISGLRVAGFGGAGPTSFGFPYEWTEEQAGAALEKLLGGAGRIDVFLSHTPPAGTKLDRTARGVSVGSPSVGRWIERAKPGLFVCGHIHESWGVESIADVPCLNAGSLGVPHEQEIAWLVEWKGGPSRLRSFRRSPGGEPVEKLW